MSNLQRGAQSLLIAHTPPGSLRDAIGVHRPVILVEKRLNQRYTFDAELHYDAIKNSGPGSGQGRVVDISSSGVLFRSNHALPIGVGVKVSIHWPLKLENAVALQLWAVGRTVRTQEDCTAVKILRYEFRTRRSD